ncbi:TIGR01244 family sulfur transferase [Qipengyuania sp. JC766]|uniref:TIGR01244 family sulfur transferase n=1 Tax=Qipengyuania sp. JC766 TaxID=3232139 RepID=UPI0034595769
MQVQDVAPDVGVTGQVRPEDMKALAASGFRSLICNRPDDEEPGQPAWADVAAAAQAEGMEVRHIPVGADIPLESQVPAFADALREMPRPILAFCRTGNRSGMLYRAAEDTAG